MSVILDALKRVQDENRRRTTAAPTRGSDEVMTEPTSNALLRRLAAVGPSRERAGAKGRQVPRVVWIAVAGIAVTVFAVAALWWFQPTYDGPAANDGRPLLAELQAANRPGGTPAAGASTTGGAVTETFGGPGDGGSDLRGAAGMAGLEAEQGEQSDGGDLFSDLSAGLDGAEEAAPTNATTSSGTDDGEDSMMRLEVEERPSTRNGTATTRTPVAAAATPSDSFLDIRSATPGDGNVAAAPTQAPRQWQPPAPVSGSAAVPVEPSDTRNSAVPTRLVDPGVRAAFAEGVQLQKAGNLEGAAKAYERALKFDPHNARVNANLGVLYESRGQLTRAEQHLRAAVQAEPDNAAAHNNLGVVLYRQGAYEAALIEFNRTLQLDPRHLDAYTNKGLIYTRWGQLENAERSFMQVLAIAPDNALAHYNLGLVYEEWKRFDQALDHYYTFLELGGLDHPEITHYLDRHLTWLERRAQSRGGSD